MLTWLTVMTAKYIGLICHSYVLGFTTEVLPAVYSISDILDGVNSNL